MRETIFLAVCNALGVDYKEAASQKRYRENVVAKQMYFSIVREIYGYRYTLGYIGRMSLFEKEVNHATVLYHLTKFNEQINHPSMKETKQIYEELLIKFNNKK